jgi:fibronectin-binding autotransporter adhesin
MPDKWPLANGNWSNAANWNGGTKPVAGDDVFADGRTVTVDEDFDVATLRTTQRSGGTVGGTFLFNTAGVTGTVTSSNPLVPGATNMVQITATTGTVTLSLGGNVAPRNVTNDILINHSGNCNFTITGGNNINGLPSGGTGGTTCISKTSAGTITITGNLNGGAAGSGGVGNNRALLSTNSNTVVIGNVVGGGAAQSGNQAINQSAGTLTVTGNVTGGQGASSNNGILFSGTSLTVNGTLLGGTTSVGIETSAPINNITGNVTAGTLAGIASSSANIVNVTGTATASSSSEAVRMTNANGQVYLNGNMVNNNGKMAIFAPIVWLDKNNTTSAAFFTSGGVARTLYSADTVPNTPAASNVRSGTIYGAGNSLRGTLFMPVAANVRNGVTYDNGTTGTALFTTSQFITELSSSTTPVAVRMQNLCTPMILGELMEAFKK